MSDKKTFKNHPPPWWNMPPTEVDKINFKLATAQYVQDLGQEHDPPLATMEHYREILPYLANRTMKWKSVPAERLSYKTHKVHKSYMDTVRNVLASRKMLDRAMEDLAAEARQDYASENDSEDVNQAAEHK